MAANLENVPDSQQRILDALRRAGGYLTKADLAHQAGVRELLLPSFMQQLMRQGRAKMVGDSAYALPDFVVEPSTKPKDAALQSCQKCEQPKDPQKDFSPNDKTCKQCRQQRKKDLKREAKGLTTPLPPPSLSIPPRQGVEGSFDEARSVAVLAQGEARIEIHPEDFVAIEGWLSALRKRGR